MCKDTFINYHVKANCNWQARDEDCRPYLLTSHWLVKISSQVENWTNLSQICSNDYGGVCVYHVSMTMEVGVCHVSMVKLMHMMRQGMQ